MNVTLNIENDAELRAYIKDCIKGQVLSVIRGDLYELIKEELERKLKGSDRSYFTDIQTKATINAMENIIYKEQYDNGFVKQAVKEAVEKVALERNWDVLLHQIVREKLGKLIQL